MRVTFETGRRMVERLWVEMLFTACYNTIIG